MALVLHFHFHERKKPKPTTLDYYIAADARYDPREAIPLWRRMATAGSKSKPPEFLSTHPSSETRIAKLHGWMPKAMMYYENAVTHETRVAT